MLTDLTGKQLIQLLCDKDHMGLIYIKNPWGNKVQPLKGFYNSPKARSIYFFSDDSIGLALDKHFNCLRIKDYLGRYRPFIRKFYKDSELTGVTYDCLFDLNTHKSNGFIEMPVLYDDIKPGDLYQPEENGEFCPVVHYHAEHENNKLFAIAVGPENMFHEPNHIEIFTYYDEREFFESVYTLIPLDLKAYVPEAL